MHLEAVMSDTGMLVQSLRLFTVQIRRAGEDKPVGTGFIVSPSGIVATCRHVLKDAGIDPDTGFAPSNNIIPAFAVESWERWWGKHQKDAARVDVYLPAAKEFGVYRDGRVFKAVLRASAPKPFNDDIALLQLEPPLPELSSQEVAIISEAIGSEGQVFRSFGFRIRGQHDSGLPARGIVTGFGGYGFASQDSGNSYLKPIISMRSDEIKGGMSGSPVLDEHKNLVIGIVESEYDSGAAGKDHDLCFAVDAAVLAKSPFEVPVHSGLLPLAPAGVNSLAIKVDDVRAGNPGSFLGDAAQIVEEWVGRGELSEFMTSAWMGDRVRVVGLIGFGGSGKSSLARNWLESLETKPDAVFWWNWNLKPSPDEFFEAAVRHFTEGKIDLSEYGSSVLRARLLARLLEGGKYLFVLDGLESIQHQAGDFYGSVQSEALRDFLTFFASPTHQSFCIVTSRAPVADLERFRDGFRWFEVDRLSRADGKALLRKLDVRLPDSVLEEIVDNWSGHVLSLALIGGQLRGRETVMPYEIPVPSEGVSQRERIQSLLVDYNKTLAADERAVLSAISMFRTAAPADDIREIFPELLEVGGQTDGLESVRNRLLSRRLVQVNERAEFTEHPLIREHYYARLREERSELCARTHNQIGELCCARAKAPLHTSELADLSDWVEAAYHFCRAGEYDRGYDTYYDKLEQGDELIISWKLNAYSTVAGILEQFFPHKKPEMDPLVEDIKKQRFIVNRLGVCRMNLGRLREAETMYHRGVTIAVEAEMLREQLYGSENLVEVSSYLGFLKNASIHGDNAVRLAEELNEPEELRDALAYRAWIFHLRGNLEKAEADFAKAEELQVGIDPDKPYLWSLYGIWHADHLRLTDNLDKAEANIKRILKDSEEGRALDDISQCRRLLGDIASARADHDAARQDYAEALKLARNMSETTVLLEALLARGRWAAIAFPEEARSDLDEALYYARGGSYGLYEADARIGLARLEKSEGNKDRALKEAQRAGELATKFRYFWAEREAGALVTELGG
jgi:tetratricopeptide (TPR) repeat protein